MRGRKWSCSASFNALGKSGEAENEEPHLQNKKGKEYVRR